MNVLSLCSGVGGLDRVDPYAARRVIWDTAFFVGMHPPGFHTHRPDLEPLDGSVSCRGYRA